MLTVVGAASAVAASVLFNAGLVLQALEARREPVELGLRLRLVLVLVRRWRWTLGLLLGLAGVGPQVLALSLAPFEVVQPALTLGLLLVLAVGLRTFGERVDAGMWLGVAAIIGGVAVVAFGVPEHAETHRGGVTVISVVVGPAAFSLLPFAVRGSRLDGGMLTMLASGAGFATTNIATKLLSDDIGAGHYGNAAAWAVVALSAGIAATVTGMTAFQRVPATVVVPTTTARQTYLPILLEPLFLREHWSTAPLHGGALAAGMVVACAGTVVVARAPSLGGVIVTRWRPNARSSSCP
jgi:drug/metabolite transporter (DMT)-like permease